MFLDPSLPFSEKSFRKKSRNILKKKRSMILFERSCTTWPPVFFNTRTASSWVASRKSWPQSWSTSSASSSFYFYSSSFSSSSWASLVMWFQPSFQINYLCSCPWFPNLNLDTWASTLRMASPTCSFPVTSAAIPGNIWQVFSSSKEYKK